MNYKTQHIFDRFSIDFSSTLTPFWRPTWAVLGHLGGDLGHLGPSWRPLGSLLGRLGGLLGPLGGQDPPKTRGRRVLEASWGRLGLIFGRFLDHFLNEFSLLILSYLTRRQHVVKPQNYYICSTGEPFEALSGHYFWMTLLYLRGLYRTFKYCRVL